MIICLIYDMSVLQEAMFNITLIWEIDKKQNNR